MEPQLTLSDVEARAAERIEPAWFDYILGGAVEERTLRANTEAFDRYELRQRVLAGIERVDLTARVLGLELEAPILCAPVAYQHTAHPDREEGLARAAGAAGVGYCLSTFSGASAAEVAAAASETSLAYQVYVFRDHTVTDDLVDQAVELGYRAIFLTVDLPVVGPRDRERRHHWEFPDEQLPAVRYARARGVVGEGIDLIDPTLDWGYLERLCRRTPLPVVVKGVLEPEDAVLAAEHGAAGVVVSNHGGRQLDGTTASIEALPRVVEAVGDRLDVLVDGGIRRGTHVATALALGARAVLIGRLAVLGLGAGGEGAARETLELLVEETRTVLHLLGCATVADVNASCVRRVG